MRRISFTLLLILACWVQSIAQVVCNNNAAGTVQQVNTSITLPSYSIPPGENSLLVVASLVTQSETTIGVTYNGNSLTTLGNSNSALDLSFWYLPLGDLTSVMSGDIVATNSGVLNQDVALFATSFWNVDQSAPMHSLVVSGQIPVNAPTSNLTVTCAPGDKAIDFITAQSNNNQPAPILTPGQDQNLEIEDRGGVAFGPFSSSISVSNQIFDANTVDMEWNIMGNSSVSNFHIAAGIKSAGELEAAAPIPTLSQWGLISLAILLCIVGLVYSRQANRSKLIISRID